MKRMLICLVLVLGLCGVGPVTAICAGTATAPAPVTAAVVPAASPLDLNAATAEEFQTIRGIGPVLAQRIVDYRKKNGPFKKVDDVLGVSGIGPVNLEIFRPLLKVSPTK